MVRYTWIKVERHNGVTHTFIELFAFPKTPTILNCVHQLSLHQCLMASLGSWGDQALTLASLQKTAQKVCS